MGAFLNHAEQTEGEGEQTGEVEGYIVQIAKRVPSFLPWPPSPTPPSPVTLLQQATTGLN